MSRTGIAIALGFFIAMLVVVALDAARKSPAPPSQGGWVVDANGLAIGWPTPYSPAVKDCMARVMPGRPDRVDAAYAACAAKAGLSAFSAANHTLNQ
jgi:hypothetical protein